MFSIYLPIEMSRKTLSLRVYFRLLEISCWRYFWAVINVSIYPSECCLCLFDFCVSCMVYTCFDVLKIVDLAALRTHTTFFIQLKNFNPNTQNSKCKYFVFWVPNPMLSESKKNEKNTWPTLKSPNGSNDVVHTDVKLSCLFIKWAFLYMYIFLDNSCLGFYFYRQKNTQQFQLNPLFYF